MKRFYKYLKDTNFLNYIDKYNYKELFFKITVLTFKTEEYVDEITGRVINGSINVDGGSSLRRSGNLTLLVNNIYQDYYDIDNIISVNKKIQVELGYANVWKDDFPLYADEDYIWYPQGIYLITALTINHSLSEGIQMQLSIQDKMCLLNGTLGGVIPASTIYSQYDEWDSSIGQYTTKDLLLYDLIREAVHHLGGEDLNKIIIRDIEKTAKFGQRFHPEKETDTITLTIHDPADDTTETNTFSYNDFVGYKLEDFIFPSSNGLEVNAGDNVCTVLDNIINQIGSNYYEYFYDIDGNFVFQEIKNYYMTNEATSFERNYLSDSAVRAAGNGQYLLDRTYGKSYYDFNDATLVTSYSNSLQYSLIKNDYVVWGKMAGSEKEFMYHLAIDNKDKYIQKDLSYYNDLFFIAKQYCYLLDPTVIIDDPYTVEKDETITSIIEEGKGYVYAYKPIDIDSEDELAEKESSVDLLYRLKKDGETTIYKYGFKSGTTYGETDEIAQWFPICKKNDTTGVYKIWSPSQKQLITSTKDIARIGFNFLTYDKDGKPITKTPADWRTYLYLHGVINSLYDSVPNDYWAELKEFWPLVYNVLAPNPDDETNLIGNWMIGYDDSHSVAPTTTKYDYVSIPYFLDFIDSQAKIGQFEIDNIGRRTEVVHDDSVNAMVDPDIPEIMLVTALPDKPSARQVAIYNSEIEYAKRNNYKYAEISSEDLLKFDGDYYNGAINVIRNMLYQYTGYNESITISTVPIYYLEPNTRITIRDTASGIYGEYLINSFSIDLSVGGEMSFNCTKILQRI